MCLYLNSDLLLHRGANVNNRMYSSSCKNLSARNHSSVLVVERLVTPVILGVDFLQQHNLVLDFASSPVVISNHTHLVEHTPMAIPATLQPIIAAERQLKSKICAVAAVEDPDDPIDHCSIPDFQDTIYCELPQCTPALKLLLEQYKNLFVLPPGKAEGTYVPLHSNSWLPC